MSSFRYEKNKPRIFSVARYIAKDLQICGDTQKIGVSEGCFFVFHNYLRVWNISSEQWQWHGAPPPRCFSQGQGRQSLKLNPRMDCHSQAGSLSYPLTPPPAAQKPPLLKEGCSWRGGSQVSHSPFLFRFRWLCAKGSLRIHSCHKKRCVRRGTIMPPLCLWYLKSTVSDVRGLGTRLRRPATARATDHRRRALSGDRGDGGGRGPEPVAQSPDNPSRPFKAPVIGLERGHSDHPGKKTLNKLFFAWLFYGDDLLDYEAMLGLEKDSPRPKFSG